MRLACIHHHHTSCLQTNADFKVALQEARQGSSEDGVPVGAGALARFRRLSSWADYTRQRFLPWNTQGASRLRLTKVRLCTPVSLRGTYCCVYPIQCWRVVVGESRAFAVGQEYLQGKGIMVIVRQNGSCQTLMGGSAKIAWRLV